MRLSSVTAAVAFLAISVQSFAAPPAAPQVTLGADLKTLRFDWEPVAGASFYRLWIKPGGTRYVAVGERIPASTTHTEHVIPVHLQDWARTRYVVTACNSDGCTGSAALNPRNLMLDTIGYLKASNADPDDHFGREVALSEDGLTLAVTAESESSGATGVNGDQSDNSSINSGAVYIFRRTGTGWRQEAYLKAPVNSGGVRFGTGVPSLDQRALALSGDGSIAVIGAPATHVGEFGFVGEVHVFRRVSTGWRFVATLRKPAPTGADFFGNSVDISRDGSTIKVTSLEQQDIESRHHPGLTHIFDRSGATWVHKVTLAPFYAGDFCPRVIMSGDGRTLVAHCHRVDRSSRAVTFKRSGDAWLHVSDLTPPSFSNGNPLALNYDASVMALQHGGSQYSVGLYRWEGSAWVSETRLFPPDNLDSYNAFGWSLALSRDGKRVAIGDYFIPVAGAGVSASALPGSAMTGAVFIYERDGAPATPWQLHSVVRAPNPAVDFFGLSIALSGSGRTLAVGAVNEDSNARGIDGDQINESAQDAGAAYLY